MLWKTAHSLTHSFDFVPLNGIWHVVLCSFRREPRGSTATGTERSQVWHCCRIYQEEERYTIDADRPIRVSLHDPWPGRNAPMAVQDSVPCRYDKYAFEYVLSLLAVWSMPIIHLISPTYVVCPCWHAVTSLQCWVSDSFHVVSRLHVQYGKQMHQLFDTLNCQWILPEIYFTGDFCLTVAEFYFVCIYLTSWDKQMPKSV